MLKSAWRFQYRNQQRQLLSLSFSNQFSTTSSATASKRSFSCSSLDLLSSSSYPIRSTSDSTASDRFYSSKSDGKSWNSRDRNRGSTGARGRGRGRGRGTDQPRKFFQQRPSTPVNFEKATRLSQAKLILALTKSIRTVSEETSTHLTSRFISFGLKGEAFRWLLAAVQYSTTKTTKNQSKGKGLTAWKREMKDREILDDREVIARLVRSWCRIALQELQPENKQTGDQDWNAVTEGITIGNKANEFASVANWDYEAISDFILYEGNSSLPRIVITEFLSWIQKELNTFKSGKSIFKPPNRNVRSLDDSSAFTPEEMESDPQVSTKTYASTLYFKSPPEPLDSETKAILSLSASSSLSSLSVILSASDLFCPSLNFPNARILTRNLHLHVGPTNSGKTHAALVALTKAKTGIFAGPLRLLAHEVFERINAGTVSPGVPPRACNLLTGEEQRTVDPLAGCMACTVEMAPLDSGIDVAVIDEIQMIGDPQRGAGWTNAVLGLAAKELHLCGEPSVIPLIERMAEACGDNITIHQYQRLTPLKVAEKSLEGELKNVKKGDCVVTFSRSGIFSVKEKIERLTGLKCAVAYGSLPPETKSEQARLFNEVGNEWDVMVASDAIGMGLNLKIKRIVFETVSKWNGSEQVFLSSSQIKQIAGRAGRYGTSEKGSKSETNSASEDEGGIAMTLHEEDMEVLRKAMEAPMVPVARAALQPPFESLQQLALAAAPDFDSSIDPFSISDSDRSTPPPAYTLPQSSSVSSIYANVSILAKVDPKSYYLSDFAQQHALSPLVERASRSLPMPSTQPSDSEFYSDLIKPLSHQKMQIPSLLSLEERDLLSNAPANLKDPLVVTWYHGAIRSLVEGKLAHFQEIEREMGLSMTEVLKQVEDLQETKSRSKAKTDAEAEIKAQAEKSKVEEVVEGKDQDQDQVSETAATEESLNSSGQEKKKEVQASVSALTLANLESLHRCISLYLWLAFRFPLIFCHKVQVDLLKKRTELAIEWGLEDMRQSRKLRLQSLGRGEGEEKKRRVDKKKGRNEWIEKGDRGSRDDWSL